MSNTIDIQAGTGTEKDMKIAIKMAFLTAGLIMIYRIVAYLVDPTMLFSLWSYLVMVLYMVTMVLAPIQKRKELGGVISFGTAFRTAFSVFLVSTIIGIFFMYVLVNFIDPSLVELYKNWSIQSSQEIWEMSDTPQEIRDKQMKMAAETDFSKVFSLISYAKSIIFYSIMGAVYSVFVAGILRRSPVVLSSPDKQQ